MVAGLSTTHSEPQSMPVEFELPELLINENGWGPAEAPDEQSFIRFALYSKSDRIGRVADWTAGHGETQGITDQYRRGDDRRRRLPPTSSQFHGNGVDSAFSFGNDREEDATFSLVDRSAPQKRPTFRRNRYMRGGYFGWRGGHSSIYGRGHHVGSFQQQQTRRDDRRVGGGYKRYNPWNEKIVKPKEPSIPIDKSWNVIGEFEFPMLSKLFFSVGEPIDLKFSGTIYGYDTKLENVKPKSSDVGMKADLSIFIDPPISSDPYIKKLSSQFPNEFVIFTSDTVLSTLMCATTSVQPWDILIERNDNVLYLDKRSNSNIDRVHINETATDIPLGESNDTNPACSPAFLSEEAVYTTHLIYNYAQDKNTLVKFTEPSINNPIESKVKGEEEVQQTTKVPLGWCYRYRKWPLGEGISIVCRVKVDLIKDAEIQSLPAEGFSSTDVGTIAGKIKFANIKVFSEFSTRISSAFNPNDSWVKTLNVSSGTIFTNLIKNNYNVVSRWVIEAVLGGVDAMKFAYTTRVNPKSYNNQILLLVSSMSPQNVAGVMNFKPMKTYWGIVKTFADYLKTKTSEGPYVLIKDPNKASLKLYQCWTRDVHDADEDVEVRVTAQD